MRANRKRGFTLIELLVSVGIIVAAVAMSTVVVGAIKVVRDSTYENAAFRIANSKLDEMRAAGYAALPANGAFSDPGLVSLPSGAASTSVTVWNDKTKKVSAGVSWLGAGGVMRYVSLTTLITETGGL